MDELTRNYLLFVKENYESLSDETIDELVYSFTLNVIDIDSYSFELLEKNQFTEFFFYIDNEPLDSENNFDINSFKNGFNKGVEKDAYKRTEVKIMIEIIVQKSFFIRFLDAKHTKNKIIFTGYDSFKNHLSRLIWTDKEKVLSIYLLNFDDGDSFKTPFLELLEYNEQDFGDSNNIPKEVLNTFDKLNELIENRALTSYLDFPLTWHTNSVTEKHMDLHLKLISSFFSIVCNTIVEKDKVFLIRGYKTVTLYLLDETFDEKTLENIIKLFYFIIDSEKFYDKLLIFRNTLTVYLSDKSTITEFADNSLEIRKTVEYNFNLYIQNKIQLFLDQKNRLIQEFLSVSTKTADLVDQLLGQFKAVALSLMGTIFISFLKDIKQVFNSPLLNVVIISYIFYFLVNIFFSINYIFQEFGLRKNLRTYTESFGGKEDIEEELSYQHLLKKYVRAASIRFWINISIFILTLIGLIVFFVMLYLLNRKGDFPWLRDILKEIIGL